MPVEVTESNYGSGGMVPLILYLGIRLREAVSFMSRSVYPRTKLHIKCQPGVKWATKICSAPLENYINLLHLPGIELLFL